MTPNEQTLAVFETRVRQMLLRFQELKEENEDLQACVRKNMQDIQQLKDRLAQADNDYNALKMARIVEITDKDLEGAKARLTKLIRDVNKCIAILSDEE
ncbi:MAG: hypothetical protein J1E58_02895 [Prevotella sp.]|nr:hypothetical protein [Prevotella sp.]